MTIHVRGCIGLFLMIGDINSFLAKPIFNLVITAHDQKAIIAVFIY